MMTSHLTKLLPLFFICCSLISVSSGHVPSEYSILGQELDKFTSEEEVLGLFQLWQKEQGREYPNQEEKAKRFQIFQRNLKHINEMNAKRKSPLANRLGLNKFADVSPEEFRSAYAHQLQMPTHTNWRNTKLKEEDDDSSDNLPASKDWRAEGAVTPVRNKGNCKSDWAFSVTGAIEGINAINTGKLITLSAQELIDCDPASKGCDGGFYLNSLGWVVKNGGIDTEANYPYTAQTGTCKQDAIKVVSIDNAYVLDGSDDALKRRVSKQPVVAGVDSRDFQLYTGGIYDGGNCSKNSSFVDLVILIVGYDSANGEDYWIVKNTWGEDWGEKGYIFIKRNVSGWKYGVCGINFGNGYPVQNTSSSPVISSSGTVTQHSET